MHEVSRNKPENHRESFMYASAIDPSKPTAMKPRSQNSVLLRGERYTRCRRYLCCVAPFSSNISESNLMKVFIHLFISSTNKFSEGKYSKEKSRIRCRAP